MNARPRHQPAAAPAQLSPPSAPIGTREELRQFIAEKLEDALVHINHGIDYADLGTDKALGYALRCASANLNAAVTTYVDLRAKEASNAR